MNSRRWFHANVVDRNSADSLLLKHGFDGSYLVRRSKSSKGDFSLSVRRGDKVVHVKIKSDEDGFAVDGGETFATIAELVDSYANGHETLQEKSGKVIVLQQPLSCSDPTSERWYHGRISRDDTEKLLKESGDVNAFLVRESNTKPGDYVIAVRNEHDEVISVIVDYQDNAYSVPGAGEYPSFNAIAELVDYYSAHGLTCADGKELKLLKPVNTTRVTVSDIPARCGELQKDRDRTTGKAGFSEEFESLQKFEDKSLQDREEGRKQENIAKNRYKNILPFDRTRVKLGDGDPTVPGSDYINANYVKLHPEGTQYIATQGCLQNTVADFWRMIWLENCSIIVMLTKLMERSKHKCTRYWPEDCNGTKVHYVNNCQFKVTFTDQTKTSDYEINQFELVKYTNVGEELKVDRSQTVFQFLFLTWPDKSVPKDSGPLLAFIQAVNTKKKKVPTATLR